MYWLLLLHLKPGCSLHVLVECKPFPSIGHHGCIANMSSEFRVGDWKVTVAFGIRIASSGTDHQL